MHDSTVNVRARVGTLEEKGKGRGRNKPEHFDISDDGPQHDPAESSSGGPPVVLVVDGDGEEESPPLDES